MKREKQIEEMAKTVCHLDRTCDECMTSFECKAMIYAKRFYDKGYRKASEVARDIVDDFDKELHKLADRYHEQGKIEYFTLCEIIYQLVIAELKKKYTEKENKNEKV